ncbi:MAG: hypothetical protein R2784_02370 [Saprospiraceae bacterium]
MYEVEIEIELDSYASYLWTEWFGKVVNVIGGVPPYTFMWDDPQTTNHSNRQQD